MKGKSARPPLHSGCPHLQSVRLLAGTKKTSTTANQMLIMENYNTAFSSGFCAMQKCHPMQKISQLIYRFLAFLLKDHYQITTFSRRSVSVKLSPVHASLQLNNISFIRTNKSRSSSLSRNGTLTGYLPLLTKHQETYLVNMYRETMLKETLYY